MVARAIRPDAVKIKNVELLASGAMQRIPQ
jgi:hypothetical protein